MTISRGLRRDIKSALRHPYSDLRLTPFVGDFADRFRVINRKLYNQDLITEGGYDYNNRLATEVERTENPEGVDEVISILLFHLEG